MPAPENRPSGRPILRAAHAYWARGWTVVPVQPRSKRPFNPDQQSGAGWLEVRPTVEDLARWFANSDFNLGVVLGARSGGLVDIDLDAPKAVALGGQFLPPTGCVYGRAAKPRSHWVYLCAGIATKRFQDPTDRSVLVEIRADGCMSVVPPSTHPSGERVEWSLEADPGLMVADLLMASVERLAAAALLARHWPAVGGRHDAQLTLSAFLTRRGWTTSAVADFVEAVSRAAGAAPQPAKRQSTARDAGERLALGRSLRGFPALVAAFGEPVARRAAEWLRIGDFGAGLDQGLGVESQPPTKSGAAFQTGSAVELAARLHADLSDRDGPPIHAHGAFWAWRAPHWSPLPEARLRRMAHAYDASPVARRQGRPALLSLTSQQITGALQELAAMCAAPDFFDAPPLGLNLANGFLRLSPDAGLTLQPHDRDHRQTSMAPVAWATGHRQRLDPITFETLSRRLFADPDERPALGEALGEVVGVAAFGAVRALRVRKAVILYGPDQGPIRAVLRLLRWLTPPHRTQAIALSQLAKEGFLILLHDAFVNAVDEAGTGPFPEERLVAATNGDPLTGKRLYEAPVSFRPQALFVMGSRGAPEALATASAALHDRLLVIPLAAGDANAGIMDHVEHVIAAEPAPLVAWAAEGAARAVRRGALAEPAACRRALAHWRADGDPVAAWLGDGEATALDLQASVGRTVAYDAFLAWCTRFGIRYPPAYGAFRQRVVRIGGGAIVEARTGSAGRTFRGLRCVGADER